MACGAHFAKEEAYEELEETVQLRVYIYKYTHKHMYICIYSVPLRSRRSQLRRRHTRN